MTTSTRSEGERLAVVFGWVSLLQDLGSKMVAPLVPLLLAGPLGAGPVIVGLVESAGQATASITAAVGGRLADRRRPLPLVRLGYTVSSVAKIAIGWAGAWPVVLGLRLTDRVGKGLRDAPRDLMIVSGAGHRAGRAFGVQQAMDKIGGFVGPLIGAAVYSASDEQIRTVFLVALVPCLLSIVVLFVAVGRDDEPATRVGRTTARRTPLEGHVRIRLGVLGLAAAGSLPVGLLLVRSTSLGLGVGAALVVFSANRLVIALLSVPSGSLADRIGPARAVILGMSCSVIALVAAAAASGTASITVALVLAGVAEALSRSPGKAYAATLAPDAKGAVLGAMGAVNGLAGMVGAVGAGAIWGSSGRWSFAIAAVVVGVAMAAFSWLELVSDADGPGTDPGQVVP